MERIFDINEDVEERLLLVTERISEIGKEELVKEPYRAYFVKEAAVINDRMKLFRFIKDGEYDRLSLKDLREWNEKLFSDILPENYNKSYIDPAFAVKVFGVESGKLLCHLAYMIQKSSEEIFTGNIEKFTEVLELFLEVYGILAGNEGEQALKNAIYYFKRDNLFRQLEEETANVFTAKLTNAYKIVTESDFKDISYLYRYGIYINEDDERVAIFLNGLSEDKIRAMATTFVTGFMKGYENYRIDLSEKRAVQLRFHVGFEKLMAEVIRKFEKVGLKCFLKVSGEGANRQAEYDHAKDISLWIDKDYVTRYLEAYEKAMSGLKNELMEYAGPAVTETFGEPDFTPVNKEEAASFDETGRKLFTGLSAKKQQIINKYSPAEKRSFAIIAYPLPSISKDKFEEIFEAVIRLNNLDSEKYKKIQQYLIDELDKGEYVTVKGSGVNKTDIKVMLHELKNPNKETNFENCVADVNIPVGEVFTSPALTGTEGVLHVTKVYLNGLLYKDLYLEFKDGKVTVFKCENFDDKEENKKFIRENLLFEHDTLPIGEFAIGTNTLAYVTGIKYDIQGRLPILIAEKTGPHFALGDTCYSMQEDHAVFNPDGKEIIARENECSMLRNIDSEKAYFNCHTDITLPYNELLEIAVYKKNGEKTVLLKDGQFVLKGTEELNEAFKEL